MSPYKLFRSLPIVGTIIAILNAYAFRGDYDANKKFAGAFAYLKALWRPLLVSFVCAALTLNQWVMALLHRQEICFVKLGNFAASPGALTVSVLPNLLGFGIGVYALAFNLPDRLVRDMDELIQKAKESGKRKLGSVLVLNADLGYPLIVMALALAIGVFQQIFENVWWMIGVCWFAFWYSIVSMVEIVGVLFHLGDNAILEKREYENDHSDTGKSA